jgi:WD40 repeat protein
VWSAQFSLDGTQIVTASWDKTARVWKTDGTLLATLQGHSGEVWSAAFSRDGTRIVTASSDRTARVWKADGTPLTTLQGHTGEVTGATFSLDGTQIVTASWDATARVYPVRTEDLLAIAACRLPRNLTADELQRFDVGTPRFDRTKYQCPPTAQP